MLVLQILFYLGIFTAVNYLLLLLYVLLIILDYDKLCN